MTAEAKKLRGRRSLNAVTKDRDLKILRLVFQIKMRSQAHLSRLIAHLVPISTVPSGSDKYPTSISVISYFRYSVFTVFLIVCFFTLKFLTLIPT